MNTQETVLISVVAVGDGNVGKTCLFMTELGLDILQHPFIPKQMDPHVREIEMISGLNGRVMYTDTIGGGEYDRFRPLLYNQANPVFLFCFDISSPISLQSIKSKYYDEVMKSTSDPGAPKFLVGCKSDLRSQTQAINLTSVAQAEKLAKSLKMDGYIETSSSHKTLNGIFDRAVESTMKYIKKNRSIEKALGPPVKPKPRDPPEIKICQSTHKSDMLRLLYQAEYSDCIIRIPDKTPRGESVRTHQAILCCASEEFKKIVTAGRSLKEVDQLLPMNQILPIVKSVRKDETSNVIVNLNSSPMIDSQALTHMLEFLYTGDISFNVPPHEHQVSAIISCGEEFNIPDLVLFCDSLHWSNFFMRNTRSLEIKVLNRIVKEKEDYLYNDKAFSDVTFNIKGHVIYAHKCILVNRSDKLAELLSKNENDMQYDLEDSNYEVFSSLLKYIYTHDGKAYGDIVPLWPFHCDPVLLMIQAAKYNLPRLINMCEFRISTLKMHNSIWTKYSAISLLNISNSCKAKQLSEWLLHYISNNYIDFCHKPEWAELSGDNLVHVERNRWPPSDYLNKMKEYQEQLEAIHKTKEKSCQIM